MPTSYLYSSRNQKVDLHRRRYKLVASDVLKADERRVGWMRLYQHKPGGAIWTAGPHPGGVESAWGNNGSVSSLNSGAKVGIATLRICAKSRPEQVQQNPQLYPVGTRTMLSHARNGI
jgi:hypothetical protein